MNSVDVLVDFMAVVTYSDIRTNNKWAEESYGLDSDVVSVSSKKVISLTQTSTYQATKTYTFLKTRNNLKVKVSEPYRKTFSCNFKLK